MASFEFLEDDQTDSNGQARFTVFGVGGAGGNAVQHMLESDIQGVKFVCANTDKQALDRMNAQFKIQLGEQSTRGLGAGANPNVGQAAAEEGPCQTWGQDRSPGRLGGDGLWPHLTGQFNHKSI